MMRLRMAIQEPSIACEVRFTDMILLWDISRLQIAIFMPAAEMGKNGRSGGVKRGKMEENTTK
jgi:hypothetical protein